MTTLRKRITSELTFETEPFKVPAPFSEFERSDSEFSPELTSEVSRRAPRRASGRMRLSSSRGRRPMPPPRGPRFPAFPLPLSRFDFLWNASGEPGGDAEPDPSSNGDADQPTDQFDEWEWSDRGPYEVFNEWMGEVSRSSAEYTRWVQQSLNKILGLRLAIDGISGTQTRSAVRSFQQRAGLTVDGVVGPQTEGGLIKFGASPPPGSSGAPATTPGYSGSVPSYGCVPSYSGSVPSYGGTPSFGGSGFQFVQVSGIEKTTQAFRNKTASLAQSLGIDPNYLMAIMSFESSLNPKAVNSQTRATGLIQFMPSTATCLGTTVEALAQMTGEQQLDYVLKYFFPYRGKLGTLEDAYMAVLYPSAMGKGADHVLFSFPSDAYKFNDVLDINDDGKITVAEATSFVRKKLPAGYKTGSSPAPGAPAANPSGVSPIGINTPLPTAGPGFYSYTTAAKRFGLSKTIQAVMAVGAAWQQANPGGPRLGIGNISFQGGGPFPPHVSHQKGVDVDIRPVRNDRKEEPVTYQSAGYSRALTQQLVDIIRANRTLSIRTILFNDPSVSVVSPYQGHDDHLHVSFNAA